MSGAASAPGSAGPSTSPPTTAMAPASAPRVMTAVPARTRRPENAARPRPTRDWCCTSRNNRAATKKPAVVRVASASVPSVDAQTNSASAGATAPIVARRQNARASAVAAMNHPTRTESTIAPSVAGAGTTAVRSSCTPSPSRSARTRNVSSVGIA